jgi:hypothetical protein
MRGTLDGEKALLGAHPPAPAARLAGDGTGSFFAAAAVAVFAKHAARHANLGGLALECFLQGDLQVVTQVRPAALTAGAAAAHEFAEHLVEDVGESAGEVEAAGPGRPRAAVEGGMAEAVVGGPLLLVPQDLVGLADFLELMLGRGVSRIAVRVILHGPFPIGPLDLVLIGRTADAQGLVIILFGHQ